MSPRVGPGKARMEIMIDRDMLVLCKRLHRAYNRRTGLSISFTKFAEAMLASYLNTQDGKELLQYAIREGIYAK